MVVLSALVVIGGCRTPAARFGAAGRTPPSRHALFARHLVQDSAVELTCQPWQSSKTLLAEPVKNLCAVARGSVGMRLLMPLSSAPGPIAPYQQPMELAGVETEIEQLLGSHLQSAQVRLYADGQEALDSLKHLLEHAGKQIDVVMFQWETDALGEELVACLAARSAAGVRVRVLVDGGGNLVFGRPRHHHENDVNCVVERLARTPNVEVIRSRVAFGRVDHRKLVLVDGQVAWTGGRNFTHASFFDQHDLSFTVQGPLVAELQQVFAAFWQEQGGENPTRSTSADARGPALALGAGAPNARAQLLTTAPMQHEIEQLLYELVDRAQQRVYLENYTLCDSLLVYKLGQARRRGADVRVVLSLSPECTPWLNRANRVIANRLLGAGVRVYIYPGMTHVKAATVDGCWAYLGTGNFDPLSLRRNRELGFAIAACPLVEELEQVLFEPDFCPQWELREPLPLSPADYVCEVLAGICL